MIPIKLTRRRRWVYALLIYMLCHYRGGVRWYRGGFSLPFLAFSFLVWVSQPKPFISTWSAKTQLFLLWRESCIWRWSSFSHWVGALLLLQPHWPIRVGALLLLPPHWPIRVGALLLLPPHWPIRVGGLLKAHNKNEHSGERKHIWNQCLDQWSWLWWAT